MPRPPPSPHAGLLLLHGALPFWAALLASARAQALLRGLRAAAAGLLLASALTLFDAIRSPPQHALALLAFAALRLPRPARLAARLGEHLVPMLVVLAAAVLGVPFCLPGLLQQPAADP